MLSDEHWQSALAVCIVNVLLFSLCMLLSVASGFWDWPVLVTSFTLFSGILITIGTIPAVLNLSRSFFHVAVAMLLSLVATILLSFALHYRAIGIIGPEGAISREFRDALYFSVTTFTTLGYGDFRALPAQRLNTSIEAIFGLLTVALTSSLIWLWCQENMVPAEMAFFDGDRRRPGSLGHTRIRVRTILGRPKKLPRWVLPAKSGFTYKWNAERHEWIEHAPSDAVQEADSTETRGGKQS